MRSPDVIAVRRTPLRPLLVKELRGILSGRALWTMLLIMCPIVGFSFFQAVSLYGEASAATSDAPVLASGLSPLDGVLVPTFGAFYVTVTLLFPFVAIRALGREKETGTLRLLVQLPYRTPTLIAAKFAAVAGAWLIALIPAVSALVLWLMLGGHLHAIETLNLLVGHLLYGLLIGAVALLAAAITESAATAAIVTLAVTIGSWILDFALAGQPGLAEWVSRLSLTQTLRPFEQGLFSLGLALRQPGHDRRPRGARCAVAASRRSAARQARAIAGMRRRHQRARAPCRAGAHHDRCHRGPAQFVSGRRPACASSAARTACHHRSSCARGSALPRPAPQCAVEARARAAQRHHPAGRNQSFIGRSGDDSYGEVEYDYAGRIDKSRSTSHREILPLLYGLAGVPIPTPVAGEDYPGYPLVANAALVLPWFFGVLPLLIALAWWWSRRAPRIALPICQGGKS